MGRRPWRTRETVEECLRLDVYRLVRAGVLNLPPGESKVVCWIDNLGCPVRAIRVLMVRSLVCLQYEANGREVEIKIAFGLTRCPFGGFRRWFRCPGKTDFAGCGRIVSALYLPEGASRFCCRHCWNLSYRSAQTWDSRVNRLRKLDPTELAAACVLGSPRLQKLARKALALSAARARRQVNRNRNLER